MLYHVQENQQTLRIDFKIPPCFNYVELKASFILLLAFSWTLSFLLFSKMYVNATYLA